MAAVEDRIQAACRHSGRPRPDITLVAVTKIFPADVLNEAYDLGIRDFGENYVQELAEKISLLKPMPGARFHLIGHLQSNKTKPASDLFQVIQTIDSVKLARRLDANGKKIDIMVEVKLSEEASKAGAKPENLPSLLDEIRSCANLRLLGLMTMPPWSEDAELSRPFFAQLRELASRHDLRQLSMGMSHDFEVAIEEGATHIRVGTALFGKRRKP